MFTTPRREFIQILDTTIAIEIDTNKCNNATADGLYENELITLRSTYLDEDHYKRVFFHECFHALCEALGCQLDLHMEETLAHTMSKMHTGIHT